MNRKKLISEAEAKRVKKSNQYVNENISLKNMGNLFHEKQFKRLKKGKFQKFIVQSTGTLDTFLSALKKNLNEFPNPTRFQATMLVERIGTPHWFTVDFFI